MLVYTGVPTQLCPTGCGIHETPGMQASGVATPAAAVFGCNFPLSRAESDRFPEVLSQLVCPDPTSPRCHVENLLLPVTFDVLLS